jgi:hypothetical protein
MSETKSKLSTIVRYITPLKLITVVLLYAGYKLDIVRRSSSDEGGWWGVLFESVAFILACMFLAMDIIFMIFIKNNTIFWIAQIIPTISLIALLMALGFHW